MAFNKAPQVFLGAGYTAGTGLFSLSTSDSAGTVCLPEVTDVEAHPTTGDIRKVIFGLMEKLHTAYQALALEDRPQQMSIGKSVSVDAITGISYNEYRVSLRTQVTAQEVIDEPAT